jgi:catechol 2,3-dioxygenase-like lactoylglutathione lyase family enzyme
VLNQMYSRAIGHIGINTDDIVRSVKWYCEVFGFQLLTPVNEIELSDDSECTRRCKAILGDCVRRFKIARIIAANGVVIEFFQYDDIEGEIPCRTSGIYHPGLVHLCIIDEDIEGMIKRIIQFGGKQRSNIFTEVEGTAYKCAYCEDLEGNVIEITTHSSDRMYANI